jgi:DNA-binding beta-propeller fold protein YncE
MKYARRAPGALSTFAVALALAGCNGQTSSLAGVPSDARLQGVLIASPAHHGWLSPAAKTQPLVYVSDNSANAIEIYPQGQSNPSPIGEITDGISGPLGNFVDRHGTLYVANAGNSTVTEYPAGSTMPSVTLSSGLNYPISVAVDHDGNVAVGEFAQGAIVEFLAGSSTPQMTLTLLTKPEGLTFDDRNHLWAAWNEGSSLQGRLSKCAHFKPICHDQGITEGQSGGVALDRAGNRILGDITNQVINIYAPGSKSPARTISTTGHYPVKFALDQHEKTLYVADYNSASVLLYDYASGTQTGAISSGLESAWGVALSPAAKPGP